MKREVRGDKFVHGVGIRPDLIADHPQPAFLVRRQSLLFEQPRLEARAQLARLLFRDIWEHHVAVLINSDPFPRRGVDMIIDIEG